MNDSDPVMQQELIKLVQNECLTAGGDQANTDNMSSLSFKTAQDLMASLNLSQIGNNNQKNSVLNKQNLEKLEQVHH